MAHVSVPLGGDTAASSIGRGQVFDSSAFSPSPAANANNASGGLPQWSTPTRSHYQMDQSEILKGLANRFVHSTAYIYLYASMAFASLVTVVMSLTSDCPGTLFYVAEMLINVALVVEVGVRFVAFGKQFWHSTFNILDLLLVLLCTITLLVIFFSHECSPYNRGSETRKGRTGKGEELLDSFLLIFRNGMQLIRLLAVVRRSGRNALSRPSRINLDPSAVASRRFGASTAGDGTSGVVGGRSGSSRNDFSLDIDLDDDVEATKSRMRDGGDYSAGRYHGSAGGSRRGAEHEQLMRPEDEDEEL